MTALTEELVRSFTMVDRELLLTLKEIGTTSPPDEALPVCGFRMTHSGSGEVLGHLNLRVGYTENVVRYRGNIGFEVLEPFHGHGYSTRSCRLLVPLLRSLSFSPIWITCNVNNEASRKSIENLGAQLVATVEMPADYEHARYYPPDARQKLRYRWDVSPPGSASRSRRTRPT
jgi:predicted acetyltransferase